MAYDHTNQSALMTALTEGQYELYALLQSEGLMAGKNEELSEVIEELADDQKHRLKQAKLQYFGKTDDSHIIYLLSKSRLGIGQEKKELGTILELYKKLDAIPEISTILKVVEHCEGAVIIFDFNRDSVIDVDPTKCSATRGASYFETSHIYVGAKDHSTVLGTLAHELTHLAIQVCYNNQCNPYEALDAQKKCAFDKIVAKCPRGPGIDNIIDRVFNYKKCDWSAELIVCVPHLLAHYKEEQGKQLLTQQAPELFSFYKQHTQEDLRNFVANVAAVKARRQVQHVNGLLGKLDEIERSNVWLSDECLLNDDIINVQDIQILGSSLPRLTLLNLYQVLKRKQLSISDIKSGYIFVSAKQFKNQKIARSVLEAFQAVVHPTLIIDCSYEYDKSETHLWSTINRFSEKKRIIFIAATDVAQSLEMKLKEYKAKIMPDREYTWSDLTPKSQKELLESTVCFQGSMVSLNELISAESPVTKILPVADLIEEKTLEIGKPVLTSVIDGCIKNCYIPRTFNHQVAIKKDIFEKKFSDDLLATTEQEFRKFCQDKSQKNVHWLLKDKKGRLIWQQSRGSLKALHEYIDTQNPVPYPPENLDEFLEQAHCQKLMLIADKAGMGKTTVLTHLSEKIKQKLPTYWVVRVGLSDHTDVLEDLAKQEMGTNEFLSEKVLKLHDPFEKELFKRCCQGLEEATKVVLMFDGFDEISPKYKETVLDLLQDLNPQNQHWLDQLWVTTRLHLREDLEDHLQQLCYTLEPFSEESQVGFLKKFWHQHLKLQEGNQQLETYARALIELSQLISDKEKEFTGIPLQTRMLAEAFEEEVKNFCLSQNSEPELPKQLCLVDLYKKFIENRWNIFTSKGEIAKELDCKIMMSAVNIPKNHQKLALEILIPELKDRVSILEESNMLAPDEISRIGIVQYVDDKPHFIHHTFAEYYVADFLVTQLTKETCFLVEVLNTLFKILLEADYGVIRLFVDGLLVNLEKSKVVKQVREEIYKIWKVEVKKEQQLTREELKTVLYLAAAQANAHTIDFFFSSLKATSHSDTIQELLLHILCYERNAWLVAARRGHLQTLETLWGWGNEVKVNLKHNLLLAKDKNKKNAFQIAGEEGKIEILEKLWDWGREKQVNLKDDLLLSKDRYGETAWHQAAMNHNNEILEKLWSWGREEQVNLKDDLLLSKGSRGRTAWHLAARNDNKEILVKLWSWGSEERVNLKDDLLLSKDRNGETAWHIAATNHNKEILEKLWSWGREEQVNLKDDLLVSKHRNGETTWHLVARNRNKEILEKLWSWGREEQVNLKDDLLLSKGSRGRTAWHLAARNDNKEILEKLWSWGREEQVNLKDDLLLSKDRNGETAWHLAAMNYNKEILEKLWSWGREEQVNLKDDLLLSKDRNGETAWYIAAMYQNKDILEKLWSWGREEQVNLKDDLLLSKYRNGETTWNLAVSNDNKDILEKLWSWGREEQVNLKDELLLSKDLEGRTAWHIAVLNGNKGILEKLWSWGREEQVYLKDDLLLSKGSTGRTAWYLAARNNNKDILEKLWSWGREEQVNLKDDLLLSKDWIGQTAWHLAAKNGKKEILENLWSWGREEHVNLKDDLLLSKNSDGVTAWHLAAINGNKKILENLWRWGREEQLNLRY
jgi:ankyrin repeat protein